MSIDRKTDHLNAICVAMKDLFVEKKRMPKQDKLLPVVVTEPNLTIRLEQWLGVEPILNQIERCEKNKHKQQVAFSTYERAFTQVCFTCKSVRTCAEITEI